MREDQCICNVGDMEFIEANKNVFEDYESFKTRYIELVKTANQLNIEVNPIEIDYQKVDSYQTLLNVRAVKEILKDNVKILERAIKNKENELAVSSLNLDDVAISQVNGVKLIFQELHLEDASLVKQIADKLQDKHQDCVIFVMSVTEGKVMFVAKSNKDYVGKMIMCGNLVKQAAILCGGNGGGRPDFAQAGGKDSSKAHLVRELIEGLL